MGHVKHMLGHRDPPVVTKVPGETHLLFLLMEAQRAQDMGDLRGERANLVQAIFCAATTGRGSLSVEELGHRLDALGYFEPGGAA